MSGTGLFLFGAMASRQRSMRTVSRTGVKRGILKAVPLRWLPFCPFCGFRCANDSPSERCLPEVQAFIAMVEMEETFLLRRTDEATTDDAQRDVLKFMRLCVAADWARSMHPKFHWLFHLMNCVVISAIVCESKHKEPKRYARDQRTLKSYDQAILQNVSGSHFSQLVDQIRFI